MSVFLTFYENDHMVNGDYAYGTDRELVITEGLGDIFGKIKSLIVTIINKIVSLLKTFVSKVKSLLKVAYSKIKEFLNKLLPTKEDFDPQIYPDDPKFAETKCMSLSNWEESVRQSVFKGIRRAEFIINKAINSGDFFKRKLTEYGSDANDEGIAPGMNKEAIKAYFYKTRPPQPITGRSIYEFKDYMENRMDDFMKEFDKYIDRFNDLQHKVGDVYSEKFSNRNSPDVDMGVVSYNNNLMTTNLNQISQCIDLMMEFLNETTKSYVRRIQLEYTRRTKEGYI